MSGNTDLKIWMPIGPVPRSLRWWLIKKLAGEEALAINLVIRGGIGPTMPIGPLRVVRCRFEAEE